MARRTQGQGRFSNRQKTWFWILATTAVVIALLYWEQIALLYVLATLSMTTLLLIVAMSDLSGAQTVAAAPAVELRGDVGALNDAKTAAKSSFGVRPRKSGR
jgi:hypothetical protein